MNFAPERATKEQEESCPAVWVWGAQEGDWVSLSFHVAELHWLAFLEIISGTPHTESEGLWRRCTFLLLYLSILLQLILEFIFSCLQSTIQQYKDLNLNPFLKFVTALYVSPYSAIIRFVEIRGNSCAFRVTAIRVFVFTMVLNEDNVLHVVTSTPHTR
jgi:hypothetical protein